MNKARGCRFVGILCLVLSLSAFSKEDSENPDSLTSKAASSLPEDGVLFNIQNATQSQIYIGIYSASGKELRKDRIDIAVPYPIDNYFGRDDRFCIALSEDSRSNPCQSIEGNFKKEGVKKSRQKGHAIWLVLTKEKVRQESGLELSLQHKGHKNLPVTIISAIIDNKNILNIYAVDSLFPYQTNDFLTINSL